VNPESRQTTFDPTLLPDDQEAIEFFLSLTALERRILAASRKRGIRYISRIRECSYSQVARYLVKAAVALKKFQ
jgi:hypothetical protein